MKNIKRSGFSLAGAMIFMLVTSFAIMASIPLMTQKSDLETNTSSYAQECILKDGADLNSKACIGAITGCAKGVEKDCQSLFFYADSNEAETFKLARSICDDGGEQACKFLMDQCVQDENDCNFSSGNENDLRYYLDLPGSDSNPGRAFIEELGTAYYDQGMPYFKAAVGEACNDEYSDTQTLLSTACVIMGRELVTENIDFDEVDRPLFFEENSLTGTDFDSGVLTLNSSTTSEAGWVVRYGKDNKTTINNIELSGDYLYASGNYWVASNQTYYFVMKIRTEDGAVVWRNRYGAGNVSGIDYLMGLTVSGGDPYITGWDRSGGDIFVARLDGSDGTVVWRNRYGNDGWDEGWNIDSYNGNLYVVGEARSRTIVMKLDSSDGSVVWRNEYGSTNTMFANHNPATIKAAENYLYVAGNENETGTSLIFVMKLRESDGTVVWRNHYGGGSKEYLRDIKVVGGYIYGTGVYASGSYYNILLVKLDESDGTVVWRNHYGTTGFGSTHEEGNAIEVDGGYIYVCGQGGGAMKTSYIMKFNESDGSTVWIKKILHRLSGIASFDLILSGNTIYQAANTSYGYLMKYPADQSGSSHDITQSDWESFGEGPIDDISHDSHVTTAMWPVHGGWAGDTGMYATDRINSKAHTSHIKGRNEASPEWACDGGWVGDAGFYSADPIDSSHPSHITTSEWTYHGGWVGDAGFYSADPIDSRFHSSHIDASEWSPYEGGWAGDAGFYSTDRITESDDEHITTTQWAYEGGWVGDTTNFSYTLDPLDDPATDTEIVEESDFDYYPEMGGPNVAYATTVQYSNIQDVDIVSSVTITQTTPTSDTDVRWLVSFDEGATWEKWNGSAWSTETSDLDSYDFQANGNTYDEIETGLTNYIMEDGENTIDFAMDLASESSNLPTVDNIEVNYYPEL